MNEKLTENGIFKWESDEQVNSLLTIIFIYIFFFVARNDLRGYIINVTFKEH